MIEVVVGREELNVGEVLGRLEDPGDLETRRGGIVDRGSSSAAGKTLQLDRVARVENMKRLWRHRRIRRDKQQKEDCPQKGRIRLQVANGQQLKRDSER